VPFDDFFDVVATGLRLIEENVNFVHATKEVVKVAHDVLIRAHEEKAEIVRLTRLELMERQSILDVAKIDELRNLTVRITGDVHERGIANRLFIKAMNRDNRKKMLNGPVCG